MDTRRRRYFLLLAALLPVLGLAARAKGEWLPPFLRTYLPDALWALLVYALIVSLWPHWRPTRTAATAVLFAFAIEFSQLYQAEWINLLRSNRLGALILGHGFLWSDLACYLVGIGAGAALDSFCRRWGASPKNVHDTDYAATIHSRIRN